MVLDRSANFPADVARAGPGEAETGGRNTIRIPKTADIVAAHIRNLIIRGELTEGDYLQPEALLMERFTTSRPTLREAFRILENEGLISVTRGSRTGARVHRPSVASVARSAGFALQADKATLADIYETRLAIEPFAANLAAQRRTPEMVARLRGEYDQLAALLAADALQDYRVGIARFHRSIVEISGARTLNMVSLVLQRVIETHQSQYRESPARMAALKGQARARYYQSGMQSLQRIIDLIAAGDGQGAEAHWRGHIESGNQVWLAGYDGDSVIDVLD